MDVGNLITGSSAFLKSSLNLYNFLVHVLLKPILENFEYYFAEWGPREAFWWLQPPEGPWARLPSQAASRLLTLRTSARFGVSTSLQQRHKSVVACCWVRGTECNTVCTNPFEGGLHYLHYPHHSLALGQTTEREHPSTENYIKDLLSIATHQNNTQFPSQSISPSGSFHKPLILIHQRPDRRKTTITEN